MVSCVSYLRTSRCIFSRCNHASRHDAAKRVPLMAPKARNIAEEMMSPPIPLAEDVVENTVGIMDGPLRAAIDWLLPSIGGFTVCLCRKPCLCAQLNRRQSSKFRPETQNLIEVERNKQIRKNNRLGKLALVILRQSGSFSSRLHQMCRRLYHLATWR